MQRIAQINAQLASVNWAAIRVQGIAQVVTGTIVGCVVVAPSGSYTIPAQAPVSLAWGTTIYIAGFTFANTGDVAATFHGHYQLIDPDGIVRLEDWATRTFQPHTAYGLPNSASIVLDKPTTNTIGTWYISAILETV